MTTPDDRETRALTVRQPWAALIAHNDKRVENRKWSTRWRGTLLIHAAKAADPNYGLDAGLWLGGKELGAIVAVARLADCHWGNRTCTAWSELGAYHWVLADVVALPRPVPCSGVLGLWTPGQDILHAVAEQLGPARTPARSRDDPRTADHDPETPDADA